MIRRRLLFESARALRRYKGRSALIMFGTVVAIALVTVVLSLAQAAQAKITMTVRQIFGGSSMLVTAGGTSFLGGPRPNSARLTIDDIAAVATAVPDIAAWDPQQSMPRASVKARDRVTTVRVLGQSERSAAVWDRPAVRGRFFDTAAVRSAERVAVIGETVATALFPGEDPIGRDLLIESVPFEVIGVLARFGADLHGMDRDNEIVVPVSTLMRRVMNTDTIIVAKLILRDPDRSAAVTAAVRRELRQRHGLGAGQRDDFSLMTPDEVQRIIGTARDVISTYIPLGATVLLLLSGVTAALLMLSAVNQRKGEIGVRRAVGALAGDIGVQFATETACTTFAGGVLGVMIGYGAAQFVVRAAHIDDDLSLQAVAIGLALSVVIGAVAGLLPARRAAGLNPAVILR